MQQNALLHQIFPHLEEKLPWVSLIPAPTEVLAMRQLGKEWGHSELWIKREDQTDSVYGGNKVRNLEFVLAGALAERRSSVLTLVPYGSNFTAALSAQAKKLGLQVHLSQFIVYKNPQVVAHADFCADSGAVIRNFPGKVSAPMAAIHAAYSQTRASLTGKGHYWIAPGASTLKGALGHTQALFELKNQVEQGLAPEPDYIVVGAGTCGTISGLLAGTILAGMKTQVIGVQAADSLVCNRKRISRLSNEVLSYLGSSRRILPGEVLLRQSPENQGYGLPTASAQRLISLFEEKESVPLDTTYTAKVASFLEKSLKSGEFRGKKILYWHTYCPNAYRWVGGVAQ